MSTFFQLAGAALVVAGVLLVSIPAGLIVAGVFGLLIGLAVRK
jgi:hypothetical protein